MSFQVAANILEWYSIGEDIMSCLNVEGLLYLRVGSNIKVEKDE